MDGLWFSLCGVIKQVESSKSYELLVALSLEPAAAAGCATCNLGGKQWNDRVAALVILRFLVKQALVSCEVVRIAENILDSYSGTKSRVANK
jgi:hypothetical protein